ncbi:MAG: Asp-tRNA(Asn)/Glu-tRNA(Gln) amidotransferase subunit GatC [Micavibrio sp.]
MSLDKATVKKVAALARIAMTDDDLAKYTPQLSGMLKWVEQLSEVNTDNVKPLASVVDIELELREDKVTDGGKQDDILANAPESVEGFFVVPKVVE